MKIESVYDQMTKFEKEVAIMLKDPGIKWSYEQPVFVWDENKRPRVWAPDFYLVPFGIYVEICGSEKFDYEYRRKIFEKNGYRVIFLHLYKEKNRWLFHFISYLESFTQKRNYKLKTILQKDNL